MHIFVGSHNPVKINAVIVAASETWPDATILGHAASSGVSEQPIGDEMTRTGAQNRAKAALAWGVAETPNVSEALGVGLEGGVINMGNEMWSTVWVAVVDKDGYLAESNGARFLVPELVAKRIRAGEEMGPIVAQVSGLADVRKKQGFIGVITQGFVDRTEEYSGITKMALGIWYGRNWQDAVQ